MDCEEQVYSEEHYDFIVEHMRAVSENIFTECVQRIDEQYDVFYQESEGLLPLSVENYSYQAIPKCFVLMDKQALESSGILRMQDYPTLMLRGQGVMLGFVDTGIDYSHPAFLNSDGTSRIVAIWDQTERSGDPPEGFLYGSEYRQKRINEALRSQNPREIVPTTDSEGHGTFLAGIAAGSENAEADFIGAAPYSYIAVVRLKEAKQYLREFFYIPKGVAAYQENDIMAGISYLNKLAISMGVPLVLCLGLGTNTGSHGGVASPLAGYLNTIGLRPQRTVVLAAGNEGNQRHHFAGMVSEGEAYQNVEVNVGENVEGFTVELWARAPELFAVEIVSPTGQRMPREYILSGGREYDFLLENTRVSVDYRISGLGSGDQLIYMRFTHPVQGIWNIRVFSQVGYTGIYNMWLPVTEMISGEVYFIRSNPDMTITVPANIIVPITAAAYDMRDNSIYINSGRGYTLSGFIKPDLAAPGVTVYGPKVGGGFETRSGTSVAAAITAGASALLMEWAAVRGNYTTISTTGLKNILLRGTDQDPYREYPNREWGYGRLNLYKAFQNFRQR